jgi:hypothetical protein
MNNRNGDTLRQCASHQNLYFAKILPKKIKNIKKYKKFKNVLLSPEVTEILMRKGQQVD